jgi:hypothetical protein
VGCEYANIINYFLAHPIKVSENKVNTDNIDLFLTSLTDIYVSILENGVVSVDSESIQFMNNQTKEFFITGLYGLKQAVIPQTLESILEFLFYLVSRDQNVSNSEMFEIYLLAKIMPRLRPESDCIKKYIDFLVEFCSGKTQHHQIVKFAKFIDMYDLTDCHILNLII